MLWLKRGKGATAGLSWEFGHISAARNLQGFLWVARLKPPEEREDPKGMALGQRQVWNPSLLTSGPASFCSGTDDRSIHWSRQKLHHRPVREGRTRLWTSEAQKPCEQAAGRPASLQDANTQKGVRCWAAGKQPQTSTSGQSKRQAGGKGMGRGGGGGGGSGGGAQTAEGVVG